MSENQTKIISSRIQHKHDIEANWLKAESFIPLSAELIIYDTETVDTDLTGTGRTEPITYTRFKIGDGSTPINDLPFVDFIATSQKGAASGVATLDSQSKIPVEQIPNNISNLSNYYNKSEINDLIGDCNTVISLINTLIGGEES